MKDIPRINIIPRPNRVNLHDGLFRIERGRAPDTFIEEGIDETISEPEGYKLRVFPDRMVLRARTRQGLFYGRQTIRQLLATNIGNLPCMCICDAPVMAYRGFMIDSARHFQPVEDLKKMIEAAALFKFNVFHWHLTDDQGWRIQIDKYPRLTETGSVRSSSNFGKFKEEGPHSGFYTKEQIREIVAYCADRFIEVIPEIDMPGHASAALAAYPEFSCRGKDVSVKDRGGIFPDLLCAGKEKTFAFLTDILDEVIELFPSRRIHIGGDEAPKIRWRECPDCQVRIAEEHLRDEEALQGYFSNRIANYLASKGRRAIVWNEALDGGGLRGGTTVQRWMDKQGGSVHWANMGNPVIQSDFFHYYTDYPYAQTPLDKTYNFDPVPKGIDALGMRNLAGVETPIWTEHVVDFKRMGYLCYPRFAAVAEAGWTMPAFRNARDFANRFQLVTPMLQQLGIEPARPEEWNPTDGRRFSYLMKMLGTILKPAQLKEIRKMQKDR